jgi:hypothetical protein
MIPFSGTTTTFSNSQTHDRILNTSTYALASQGRFKKKKVRKMLSALFLINAKGEIIIYRLYRDDVSLSAANAFRLQVIAAKEAGASAPVRSIDGNTFLYVRHKDMFFVAVTRSNSNAGE